MLPPRVHAPPSPPRTRARPGAAAARPPPPTLRPGHASLSPYLSSSLFAQAQLVPPTTTSSLSTQLSGKCSCGGVVMLTELAKGSLPKCTIARGEGEIKASGYPLSTPPYTSFVPLVHSSKLTAHTRAPNPSLLKIPSKAVHPPAGWRPFLGWRPRSASAPL